MISAIWRAGRVNDAADMLGLTPSALSHRAKEAERRLGVPLFERMHKRLRLTAAAEHLAETSARLLRELETVEEEVRRMNEEVDHVVRLSMETYEAYGWLPGFLAALAQTQPRTSLQIVATPAAELQTRLLERRADLAVCFTPPTAPGVADVALFEDRLAFVCALDHPLARRASVGGADLEGERFITYSQRPAPDQEFARIFRPERRYPRWTATAESPSAILALVAGGAGTSVLSHWAVDQIGHACAVLPLSPAPIALTWRARLRADEPDDSPVRGVAEALRRWFAST